MTKLFSPITFKNIMIKNRIVMSPMCMYSSMNEDGLLTSFHKSHYVSRAIGQVGLIMIEATAVQPEGRISARDLGIWGDEHINNLKELNQQLHSYGAKSAIQLAHAGRKAQLETPIYAPSALSFDETYQQPIEMNISDIKATIQAFKAGAKRAKEAQFDIIEIHAAHGYLINQFLSPLTNKRTDIYGGTRENRYRFLSEIIDAIQVVWDGPIFTRISANEYDEAGNTLDDLLYFTTQMKAQGVDLIDASSGGVIPKRIKSFPGYQIPNCQTIKEEVNIKTGAVGLITTGIQAEEIIQNERADLVFIGRSLLRNPYWPKEAADDLGYQLDAPKQYTRGWN